MKVFHDGDEKDIDTEEENDKDKKSTLRAIPTSSRAITKRMSDGDGITPAQTVRSTAVATTDGEKKKDEETSANDGEERETTTRKMSGVSLENDKENMTTIRSDTSRNDRVPLAAHAFYGMNITSSRGAVDNVAKNAWKVQKENASLKFTLHQMRHEMACMQSALKVKKEQLFRAENALGHEKKKNKRLEEWNAQMKKMIESFEGNESTTLLTKIGSTSSPAFTDESDPRIGVNRDATVVDGAGKERSDTNQRGDEESVHPTRTRRAAATGLDYTEPSLRSKLRQGSKHTFGLDSIFPTSTLAASTSPEMASEILADKPYSSFRSNRDRERRRRSSLM